MDDDASFRKVGADDTRLYGPRGLLVCGLTASEQEAVQGLADALSELAVIFATTAEAAYSLTELLAMPPGYKRGEPSGLPRAVVMSGLTEMELQLLMTAYRRLGLPQPLWATLTPSSESWPLTRLLDELADERDRLTKP